jgi:hypothetical protein
VVIGAHATYTQTNWSAGIYAAKCATVEEWHESVAQLVEHRPFKALVLGSNPSALTIFSFQHQDSHVRDCIIAISQCLRVTCEVPLKN